MTALTAADKAETAIPAHDAIGEYSVPVDPKDDLWVTSLADRSGPWAPEYAHLNSPMAD